MPSDRSEKKPGSRKATAGTGTKSPSIVVGNLLIDLRWLVPALVFAAISTTVALDQETRRDPFATPPFFSGDWWLSPLEINAYKRLSILTGNLNDVIVLPESGRLWAVGAGGLILRSDDGGQNWDQREIAPGTPVPLNRDGARSASLSELLGEIGDKQNELMAATVKVDALRGRLEVSEKNLAQKVRKLKPPWNKKLTGADWRRVQGVLDKVPAADLGLPSKGGFFGSSVIDVERNDRILQGALKDQKIAEDALNEVRAQASQTAVAPPDPAPPDPAPPDPAPHITRTLNAIAFLEDEKNGWAVGSHGVIARTGDGGETWSLQTTGGPDDALYDIEFGKSGKLGWVAGDAGLFATVDGGKSWQAYGLNMLSRDPGPEGKLRKIAVDESSRYLVALMANGTKLISSNGGENWTEAVGGETSARAVAIRRDYSGAGARVALAGAKVRVYTAGPKAPSAKPAPEASQGAWNAVWLSPDGSRGWSAGRRGSLYKFRAGGQGVLVDSGAGSDLSAVTFSADGRRGWVIGAEGTIFRSTDGGSTWHALATGKDRFLRGMHPPIGKGAPPIGKGKPPPALWKIDGKGEIYSRGEAGENFRKDTSQHRQFPAPWYYLSWLVVAGFVRRSLSRPPLPPLGTASVADQGMSDRPLEAGDPDPLNFGAIARAISKFLRNENTEPPLTIAITGDWGTGKSSILNLVKHDLELSRFRPIWFNAWHHQTEESLLAALLEKIRSNAVPP